MDSAEEEDSFLSTANSEDVDSWGIEVDASSEEEEELLEEADRDLFSGICNDDATAVRRALQRDANLNCVRKNDEYDETTPLFTASAYGHVDIIRILLCAGADARWRDKYGFPGFVRTCENGEFSAVETLLNHDGSLLEIKDTGKAGWTPLLCAVAHGRTDIVRLLMDRGANVCATISQSGMTALMFASEGGLLEVVRILLEADVDVDARDEHQQTALHHAADSASIEVVRELVVEHNANIFAVSNIEKTPFDVAIDSGYGVVDGFLILQYGRDVGDFLLEQYGNKLTQDFGRRAIHAILGAAKYSYSFDEDDEFHPPLNPLRIRLPLGELTLDHFDMLLHSLDTDLIRNRDDSGMLPIHVACRANAPVEVLFVLVEMDPATLQIADHKGALPIHSLCSSSVPAEYGSVRYLVDQGGVGTLTARNREGALPLHVLCGSPSPLIRTVQYLVQSFPESVAARANNSQYPFMVAACDSSTASLSVVYELVRTNPNVVVLR